MASYGVIPNVTETLLSRIRNFFRDEFPAAETRFTGAEVAKALEAQNFRYTTLTRAEWEAGGYSLPLGMSAGWAQYGHTDGGAHYAIVRVFFAHPETVFEPRWKVTIKDEKTFVFLPSLKAYSSNFQTADALDFDWYFLEPQIFSRLGIEPVLLPLQEGEKLVEHQYKNSGFICYTLDYALDYQDRDRYEHVPVNLDRVQGTRFLATNLS